MQEHVDFSLQIIYKFPWYVLKAIIATVSTIVFFLFTYTYIAVIPINQFIIRIRISYEASELFYSFTFCFFGSLEKKLLKKSQSLSKKRSSQKLFRKSCKWSFRFLKRRSFFVYKKLNTKFFSYEEKKTLLLLL